MTGEVFQPSFEREMGCTLAEWLRWLPIAVDAASNTLQTQEPVMGTGDGQAIVWLSEGHLTLTWSVLPPRRLGLAVLPRLRVQFSFEDVPPLALQRFMVRFDLYTRRGGG